MSSINPTETVSVTEASARGVSALAKMASLGHDVIIEKHGTPVAAMVGAGRLAEINSMADDLRSAALVLSRITGGVGVTVPLDDVIDALGFSRADLEAELDVELESGLH